MASSWLRLPSKLPSGTWVCTAACVQHWSNIVDGDEMSSERNHIDGHHHSGKFHQQPHISRASTAGF